MWVGSLHSAPYKSRKISFSPLPSSFLKYVQKWINIPLFSIQMKRSTPPPVQFLAAASTTSATISSRPHFGGGRGYGRGRGRRNYSDRAPSADQRQQLVTGDSHFHFVRDANRGFQPSGNFSGYPPGLRPYAPRPPPQGQPTYYNAPPPFAQQQSPGWRSFGPNQPNYRSQWPRGPFDNNQQFRPPQQQFRPQRSKPLDYRNWEYAKPGPPPQCERFKILSYNILADYLVRDHLEKLYKHIPRQFLDWKWRKRSIVFELRLWSADILCLQEVDRFQELEEELKLLGYNGIWKMRTGDPIDGCAIFWRASRFMLVREESIEFNKLGLRDNVAQICVFEFVGRNNSDNESAPSTSSVHHNKVVVCNIHVLFNPKRGEIKLGQIRTLFERAYAVSKLWDDAPIVICGDFNSTPKSPLYNFIEEQKLDFLELPRDKISGQASAEIPPRRPFAHSGLLSVVNSALDSPVPTGRETKETGSPLNVQCVDNSSINSVVNTSSVASVTGGDANEKMNEQPRGSHQNTEDSCKPEMTSFVRGDPEQNPSAFNIQKGPPVSDLSDLTREHTSAESLQEDIYFGLTQSGSQEREFVRATIDVSNKCSDLEDPSILLESSCEDDRHSTARETNSSIKPDKNSVETLTLGIPSELSIDNLSHDSSKVPNQENSNNHLSVSDANGDDYASSSVQYNASHEYCIDLVLDDKMGRLSLCAAPGGSKDDSVGEDSDAFLSELNDTSNFFPSDSGESQRSEFEEPDLSSKDDTSTVDLEVNGIEKSTYDPSAWTPMEIETATGSANCTVMEHPLKLKSVYGEVEDCSRTRDSNGEPVVTSYHRRFLGTVDYIWRSEGLQTVGVLAPIPKQAMQWTSGFPTKKWGSDHIALVSELAFTKEIYAQHTEA